MANSIKEIMDIFTRVKSADPMAKFNKSPFQIGAHFEVFLSCRCQNVKKKNVYKSLIDTTNSFLKVFSLTIEYKMYLRFLPILHCPDCIEE